MVRLQAHGRSLMLPAGWEGRIFRRGAAGPVVHVATFALAEHDGDFGAAATARMRPDDVFAALLEYRPDARLRPGTGLFAQRGRPPDLRGDDFAPTQLQVTRAGQLGCQRFFSEGGRAFCLYAVMRPAARSPERLAGELSAVLATLAL